MLRRYVFLFAIVIVAAPAVVSADVNDPNKAYADVAGPYKVDIVRYDWVDFSQKPHCACLANETSKLLAEKR
jgi:hypothetical protein